MLQFKYSLWEKQRYRTSTKLKLKPNFLVRFNNAVRTAKKTPYFTFTYINVIIVVKEIIVKIIGNPSHKMQSYWLLKRVGLTVTTRLKGG